MSKYILLILLLFLFKIFIAQGDTLETNNIHNSCEHNHNHHNEFGMSNALVYFVKEKEYNYGLHFHYIKTITHTNFGLGLGFERIFDKHGHNTIGVVSSYRLLDRLNLVVSPGINFEDIDINKINFALHLETSYEYEIKNIHLGPSFEFAIDSEDYHLSIGLHFAIGY